LHSVAGDKPCDGFAASSTPTMAKEAKDQGERNLYIQQEIFNGIPLKKPVLNHTDLI
jgi:hypothetical protein